MSIVVDLASTLDPDGVDVYFLNRKAVNNVRSSKELTNIFAAPPDGIRFKDFVFKYLYIL